jgi:hypothetical protein
MRFRLPCLPAYKVAASRKQLLELLLHLFIHQLGCSVEHPARLIRASARRILDWFQMAAILATGILRENPTKAAPHCADDSAYIATLPYLSCGRSALQTDLPTAHLAAALLS